jgi:hypothetical protein
MKKRFIVLIDFSPYSAHLLQFAREWSKKADAELLLVHRTFPATPALVEVEIKKEIVSIANREALVKLKNFSSAVLNEQENIKHYVSEENLRTVLPRLLNEPFNNLLFLGLKGTGILKKLFVGSVAVDVIDNIHHLTVLLPKKPEHYACESILVAVQKDYPLNTVEFDRLLELANHDIQHINFFSITDESSKEFEESEKYLKELKQLYSNRASVSYDLYKGDVIIPTLKEIIAQKKNQFLVVQKGSRMFLDQVFRTFVINQLAYEGETPLIVVP